MKHSLVFSALCLALLAGCAGAEGDVPASAAPSAAPAQSLAQDESQSAELFAMDTVMTLTAYGPQAGGALEAAEAEIRRLDSLWSISSEEGEIFALNRDGSGPVSADTQTLLRRALEIGESTGGLFDCTIAPVMEAWGFPSQNYRVPSGEELSQLLPLVDSGAVSLSDGRAQLPEGVSIDLGGIAKGFTSARVMEIFQDQGVTSGLVSLGGNVQALGRRPDGNLWRIGLQDPRDTASTFAVVEVEDQAVITSGGYQRYFEEDGVTYHHIIDPRTGYPAGSGLISVTIISGDGALADGLSTALYIMGPQEAADYWRAHSGQFDAVLMTDAGEILVTAGLAGRCQITTGDPVQVIQ